MAKIKDDSEQAVDSEDGKTSEDEPRKVSWNENKRFFLHNNNLGKNAASLAKCFDKQKRKNFEMLSSISKEAKLIKLPVEIVEAAAKTKVKKKQLDNEETLCNAYTKVLRQKKKSEKKKSVSTSHFQLVFLDEAMNGNKKVPEKANMFLQSHFYGGRFDRLPGLNESTVQCKNSGILRPALKFRKS